MKILQCPKCESTELDIYVCPSCGEIHKVVCRNCGYIVTTHGRKKHETPD